MFIKSLCILGLEILNICEILGVLPPIYRWKPEEGQVAYSTQVFWTDLLTTSAC